MTSSSLRALVELRRALTDLPAPWMVLCNQQSRADAPPWARYLAFHPEKGVALIDFVPARPDLAVTPLEEFLARTGLAAFAEGDPPIVGVALERSDIPDLSSRLDQAFAAAGPCGLKNRDWPDALSALLMMTPDLALVRLGAAGAKVNMQERAAPPWMRVPAPKARPEAAAALFTRSIGLWRDFGASARRAGQALIARAITYRQKAARAVAVPAVATVAGTLAALVWAAAFVKRMGAAAMSGIGVLIASAIRRSRSAARWIARVSGATAAASAAALARGAPAAMSGSATLIASAMQWSRSAARWIAHVSATTAVPSAAAFTRLSAVPGRARIAAKRQLHRLGRLRMEWSRPLAAASLATIVVGLVALGWMRLLLTQVTPPSDATNPEAASVEPTLAVASAPTPTGAPAAPEPSTEQASAATEFAIGNVNIRFNPPSGYCLYRDALLRSVVAQQDALNRGNVVHTVFGNCDQLREAAANPARVRDYGMLMTPRTQIDRRTDKPALERIAAKAIDPRLVKTTLDQRLRRAQSQLTLQSFSTLGVMQRDKDATYFAYLFKTNAADGPYTQACVMALTAVKGRLLAYYLYSDYTRDARATLMGLLQKVRAGVGAIEAANS